ncbi:hypothetical protein GF325_04100 [Candidatus Bathyarchaeota archaeon]|nr:hypothetical protein [Candidatus Bathyarchaeota archaeon]
MPMKEVDEALIETLISTTFDEDINEQVSESRAASKKKRRNSIMQILITVGIAIIGIVLGAIGYFTALEGDGVQKPWNVIYNVFRLFFFDYEPVPTPPIPTTLNLSRFLCAFVTIYSGINASRFLFKQFFTWVRLQFFKDHVIICGLDRKGIQIALDELDNGKKVVIIEKDEDCDYLTLCRERRNAIIQIGDATDPYALYKARVQEAGAIVAITGDDSVNIEIALNASQIIEEHGKDRDMNDKIDCVIHVANLELIELFDNYDLLREGSSRISTRIFNVYQNSSRILFHTFPIDALEDTVHGTKPVHLVIIGFGHMGKSVTLQAIKMGHFANEVPIHITIVDKAAHMLEGRFKHTHPIFDEEKAERKLQDARAISNYPEIANLEFKEFNVENLALMETELTRVHDHLPISAFIICLDDDSLALSTALNLGLMFKDRDIPIKVRIDRKEGLAKLLAESMADGSPARKSGITAFGQVRLSCSHEMVFQEQLDTIAMDIDWNYSHEDIPAGEADPREKKMRWQSINEGFKDSNRQQADHIPVKLRAAGLHARKARGRDDETRPIPSDMIEKLARMEHNRWNAERWLKGWTYSKVANRAERKTNYLIPFDDLPDDIKNNDINPVKNIPELLLRDYGLKLE